VLEVLARQSPQKSYDANLATFMTTKSVTTFLLCWHVLTTLALAPRPTLAFASPPRSLILFAQEYDTGGYGYDGLYCYFGVTNILPVEEVYAADSENNQSEFCNRADHGGATVFS
jgi:hypothetical protein